jgi:nicotinamidase-related amidase
MGAVDMNKYKITKVNSFRIDRDETVVVMIDFQERLMPAMKDYKDLEESVVKLVRGIRVLDVPVIVTQQYTKGLGPTVQPIASALGDFSPIEKTDFSAAGELEFLEALNASQKTTVVLCGIETHVCVAQTALRLLELGYDVFLVEDAVSSRSKNDKKSAINRMVQAGARPVTVEGVLFELLGTAKAPEFKEVSGIVK